METWQWALLAQSPVSLTVSLTARCIQMFEDDHAISKQKTL